MSSTPQPSKIYSSPREVQLAAKEVQPPSPLYLQAEDSLILNLICATILVATSFSLQLRWLRPDGEIVSTRKRIDAPFLPQTLTFTLGEGFLLSATLTPLVLNPLQYNGVFCTLTVERDLPEAGFYHWVLFADYISGNHFPTWPYGVQIKLTDGAGRIRSITGTAPAVGADVSETVPSSVRWRLLSFTATLTTSAVVANRFPVYVIDDGANILFRSPPVASVPASTTVSLNLENVGSTVGASVSTQVLPYDSSILLAASFRIRTVTSLIDAGDQWTAPHYLVQEWQDS